MSRFTLTTPRALLAFALTAAATSPALAQDARDEEIRALREALRQLDQKVRLLERKQEIKDEAAAASPAPTVAAGASGFSLTSADRKFQLRIRANVQADGRFYISDNVEGNDTFLLRRVRPSFEGTVFEKFQFRIMPDFAPASVTLLDAYATYQHSAGFNLLFGKTKSPFDLERLVSQTDMLFIERGYPTSLAPNRDIGVQAFGDVLDGRLSYQVGLLNGARDNDSTVTDSDDEKELVVRLFSHPFKNEAGSLLQGLGLGVAASISDKDTGSPNSYRTNAQQTFFGWRNTVINSGRHTRLEPQAYYYYGPYGLIGSWITSQQELSTGAGSLVQEVEATAWYVAANYVLTGEDAGYRGVTPATNFSWSDGTWGAFEIAARYGELEIGDEAFPIFANPATAASKAKGSTLGLNWYLNRAVKASVNFEYTDFTGGAANPITRESEKAVFSRVQLRY